MRTFPSRSAGRRLTAAGIAGVLALGLAACGDDGDDATDDGDGDPAPEEVAVTDVWARTSAPGQTAGAVYMVITGGDDDTALVGASVDDSVAATTEIHETTADDGMTDPTDDDDGMSGDGSMDDDGMSDDTTAGGDMGGMTMQEVGSIEIPAGEAVALEPGGYHLMLLDLVDPLEAGDEFDVELGFEGGGTATVTAEVRDG